ncbi:NADH-quinone oxidoreductase subunit H [Roseibium salinum]|nr:NADH-quinone oxidoreductase subunit H [Roseibium salinum]
MVPLAPGIVAADFESGIVLWGACEALTVIVVFLHGWSANAPLALVGAYRYVAVALPVILISMFVLIAAALPAESLSIAAIVRSQDESVWNIVRQPPGFLLFMLVGLSMSLRGPLDYADSADLAGGTASEASGAHYATWQLARLAMLVSVSVMAATVFLGGYLGPVLPGLHWLALKSAAVLALLVVAGNSFARTTPARMLELIWVLLLPLSFLVLALVGAELLLWG